jgi:hypothetical protein
VPVRSCIVSFTDPEGFRHSVEVQAESLYEAVVLATRAFKEHECPPGVASQLEVKILSPHKSADDAYSQPRQGARLARRRVQESEREGDQEPAEEVTGGKINRTRAGSASES